jgi:ketosteroid isomerase-like protein
VERERGVEAALDAQNRIRAYMLAGDTERLADMLSDDFVAADPSNSIRRREDVIAVLASGRLKYDSGEVEIDFSDRLGDDLVVVMGFETTTQSTVPVEGEAGSIMQTSSLRRRFTDVFRNENGTWRLLIKQSTIVALE